MYRHLIWDLGGTLVDTYPELDATLAEVVLQHGRDVNIDTVSALTRESTGRAIAVLSRRFGLPKAEFEAANGRLKRRWESSPPPATAGARELMADLRAAGGLNIVVTHRDRQSARSLIDGLGLQVDELVSASDGFPRKPDPAMHLEVLARRGLAAADCLAIGDRQIDAEAAHAAGVDAATITSPHAPRSALAKYTIATLDELRPHLHLGAPA